MLCVCVCVSGESISKRGNSFKQCLQSLVRKHPSKYHQNQLFHTHCAMVDALACVVKMGGKSI